MTGTRKRQASLDNKENMAGAMPRFQPCRGQTVKERRILQKQQRDLEENIKCNNDIGDLALDAFEEARDSNNALFSKVKYMKELVADVRICGLITDHCKKQVGCLAAGSQTYDSKKLVAALATKGPKTRHGEFNWRQYGVSVRPLFRGVPLLDFMCGPLEKPEKVKAKVERKKKVVDDAQEVNPETVAAGETGKRKLDATEARLKDQHKVLKKQMVESHQRPIDFFGLVLNPESFTQTVENIFDYSFHVKTGNAALQIAEDSGLPTAMLAEGGYNPPTQMVMAFSMADYKDLLAAYQLQGSTVPTRKMGPGTDYYDPLDSERS